MADMCANRSDRRIAGLPDRRIAGSLDCRLALSDRWHWRRWHWAATVAKKCCVCLLLIFIFIFMSIECAIKRHTISNWERGQVKRFNWAAHEHRLASSSEYITLYIHKMPKTQFTAAFNNFYYFLVLLLFLLLPPQFLSAVTQEKPSAKYELDDKILSKSVSKINHKYL